MGFLEILTGKARQNPDENKKIKEDLQTLKSSLEASEESRTLHQELVDAPDFDAVKVVATKISEYFKAKGENEPAAMRNLIEVVAVAEAAQLANDVGASEPMPARYELVA